MKTSMRGKRCLTVKINDYDDPSPNEGHNPFKSKPKKPLKGNRKGKPNKIHS